MNESEKKDVEYALAHGLTNLNQARAERLKAAEVERERQKAALRAAEEKAARERDAIITEVLLRNQDRFSVSLDRRRVEPGRGFTFKCPKCGKNRLEIRAAIMNHLQWAFPALMSEDFFEGPWNLPFPQLAGLSRSYRCSECGKDYNLRMIPIPY